MAGYSGTPLIQKLGIKSGMRVYFEGAPDNYDKLLGRLPTVVFRMRLQGPLDFVQFFTTSHKALEAKFGALERSLAPAGMLWISWPKQAAKVETDITEDVVRALALKYGLVDVKVCAVDESWSGLKLVRRLEDRT